MFRDKVVVVTGGVKGIGKCICEEFEKAGAKVCIIDILDNPYFVGDIAREENLRNFADKVIAEFRACSTEMDANWNKRCRENSAKIKSGNIYEVAQVVKSLMFRDKTRGLSTGERKMLNSAKQIMVSELVMAKTARQSEIENIMNEIVNSELA